MKTIDSGEQTLLSSGALTLAHGLKIVRADGLTLGFTSHDRDATVSGQLYEASLGVNVSNLVNSEGFNVDNLELSTLDDGTVSIKQKYSTAYGRTRSSSSFDTIG